jgi:hypothetical protein
MSLEYQMKQRMRPGFWKIAKASPPSFKEAF